MPVLTVRDRPRILATATAGLFHVDLIQAPGTRWLYRAYREGTTVYVDRSQDAGASWERYLVAGGAAIGGDGAAPTLAVSRWDDLFCWFHDADGTAVGYRSEDAGRTWALYAEQALTYPRLVPQVYRSVLAGYAGGQVTLHSTLDYGRTLESFASFTAPEQLVALRQDRRELLHLILRDGADALSHAYSTDHRTFSAPGALGVTGRYPALALGLPFGFLGSFSGAALQLHRLHEGYSGVASTLTPPAGLFRRGYLGLWVTLRGLPYLAGRIGSTIETRWADASGGTWAAAT